MDIFIKFAYNRLLSDYQLFMTSFSFEDRIKQDLLLLTADEEFSADVQLIQKNPPEANGGSRNMF